MVVVEEDEVKSTILLVVNVTINRVGGDKNWSIIPSDVDRCMAVPGPHKY